MSRVSVVTGGASGIGRETALRLARAGDLVVIADVNEAGGHDAVARIEAAGGRAAFVPLDVTDERAVAAAAEQIEGEHGPAAVLVNSAGILQRPSTVLEMDLTEHDRVWSVNYRGTYLCCREWGHRMAANGRGSIILLASIAGLRFFPLPAYSPGKSALIALTAGLAAELGPRGVRVNAVAPGYVRTEAMNAQIAAGQRDPAVMERQNALSRLVTPEDVAESIHFLCSDAAGAITGVTLPVDCGWLAGVTYTTFAGPPEA